MNNNDILKTFFSSSLEAKFNRSITELNYGYNEDDICDYINKIVSIPVEEYVNFIWSKVHRQGIMAADVFQFSKFEDATINLCRLLRENENCGLKPLQIGELLQNDGIKRSDNTNMKYGENHVKTAEMLGLAIKDDKKNYFLSCIGLVFNDLSTDTQNKLMTRLILRNKLVSQFIIISKTGDVDLETVLYDLSETTYIRRRPNIRKILRVLVSSNEYDFKPFAMKIKF